MVSPSKAPTRIPSRARSRSKYSHSSIVGDMPLPEAAWSAANAASSSRRTARMESSVTPTNPLRQVEDGLVGLPPPRPTDVVEAVVVKKNRQRHPVPGGHLDVLPEDLLRRERGQIPVRSERAFHDDEGTLFQPHCLPSPHVESPEEIAGSAAEPLGIGVARGTVDFHATLVPQPPRLGHPKP